MGLKIHLNIRKQIKPVILLLILPSQAFANEILNEIDRFFFLQIFKESMFYEEIKKLSQRGSRINFRTTRFIAFLKQLAYYPLQLREKLAPTANSCRYFVYIFKSYFMFIAHFKKSLMKYFCYLFSHYSSVSCWFYELFHFLLFFFLSKNVTTLSRDKS